MSTSSEQFPAQPAPRPWPLAPEPEPVFGLLAVLFVFLAMLLAVIFCGAFAIVFARHVPSTSRIRPGHLVFNRTLPLKDTWAKIEKKSGA